MKRKSNPNRKVEKEMIVHPPETIRSRRISLGLSQEELAGLVGLSRITVSSLERGASGARYLTLVKFSKALEKAEKEQAAKMKRLANRRRPSKRGKKGGKG